MNIKTIIKVGLVVTNVVGAIAGLANDALQEKKLNMKIDAIVDSKIVEKLANLNN